MFRRYILTYAGLSWVFLEPETVQASAEARKVVARIGDREIVLGRECSEFKIATDRDGFRKPITGSKDSKAKLILDGITLEAKEVFFTATCQAKSITMYEGVHTYQGIAVASAFEPGCAEIYLDTLREVPR